MKTVWEVIMVVTIISLFLFGLTALGNKIFTTQQLDEESLNTLSIYSVEAEAYLSNYTDTLNRSEIDPYKEVDLNDVDGFVQEYRDYKGRLDQLKDGLLLIYKIPDLAFNIVPGVEAEDLNVYIEAYRFLVWVFLLVLLIVGLKNGQLLPNF